MINGIIFLLVIFSLNINYLIKKFTLIYILVIIYVLN